MMKYWNNDFLNGTFVINEIQTGVIRVTSLALFVWLNYYKSTISVIIIETGAVSVSSLRTAVQIYAYNVKLANLVLIVLNVMLLNVFN